MRAGILVTLLLVSPGAARADWTALDTAMESAFVVAAAGDWIQTRSNVGVGLETNPILGQRPSRGTVDAYFAGAVILHAAIAYVLPRPYRTAWQAAWIGLEAWTINHNLEAHCGFRVRF